MEDKQKKNNPWSALTTVSTFDKGNHSRPTRCADESGQSCGGQIVGRVEPSTSLLIESLIKQLCTMFEGDTVRRNKLYFTICDRLHEMKLIDGSYNKVEFEIMRGQYQNALYQLVKVARAATGSDTPMRVPTCLMAEWSRYRREFQEIGFIAKGGFGAVFKALHRLDGREYAIKKIIVPSNRAINAISQHLEEVKTLAKLNHSNIVSYKGAWIEPTLTAFARTVTPLNDSRKNGSSYDSVRETTDSRSFRSNKQRNSDPGQNNKQSGDARKKREYKTGTFSENYYKTEHNYNRNYNDCYFSEDIINERFHELNSTTNIIGVRITETIGSKTGDDDTTSSDIVEFRSDTQNSENLTSHGNITDNSLSHSERISQRFSFRGNEEYSDVSFRSGSKKSEYRSDEKETYSSLPDDINSSEGYKNSSSSSERIREGRLSGYKSTAPFATIYIQMALCDQTLREWMDGRTEAIAINLVTAIISQLLNGLEYIHSHNIVHHDVKPNNIFISKSGQPQIQLGDFGLACLLQNESHHSRFGTPPYAAPEQVNGKCDPKSDIYSLGIVLMELLVPMRTDMERNKVITALKSGQIPEAVATDHPQWAKVISQLVHEDPQKRPTATDLVKYLSKDKDLRIAKLEEENTKLKDQSHRLLDRIAELEAQIEKSNS